MSEMGYYRLMPLIALAYSVQTMMHYPKIRLVLPRDWFPELTELLEFEVLHADIVEPMLGLTPS